MEGQIIPPMVYARGMPTLSIFLLSTSHPYPPPVCVTAPLLTSSCLKGKVGETH